METDWQNKLYFGDTLEILRDHVGEESVDLIYLDPPFNSKATYSVLFKEKNGTASAAQVAAFEDTWHWDLSTQAAYQEVVTGKPRKSWCSPNRQILPGAETRTWFIRNTWGRHIRFHKVLALGQSFVYY